jgi:uncharacterized protein (DUF697 family)
MHDMDRVKLETEHSEHALEHGEHSEQSAPGADHRELELATELLEVTNEQELEQFLGDLISSAGRAASRLIGSPTGQALGDVLKDAARKALPVVGKAVGDYVSPGGTGGDWGQRLGNAASQLFEMELEGLSNEDKEFELARRYVQFATAASRAAASRAANGAPPRAVARAAASHAARRYAPGLLSVIDPTGVVVAAPVNGASHAPATGRWVRRGRVVTVYL